MSADSSMSHVQTNSAVNPNNSAVNPNDSAVNQNDSAVNVSLESELDTPDVSSSTCTTFSDLGDTSIASRKQTQAAIKWSKMEKRKAKEKEKKKQKNKITKNDFYTKSLEYKAWLQECKGLNFEDIDPKKQKEYFKKFVKKWNSKKLDKKYYRGVDCLWAHGTPNTQVNWALPGALDVTPGSVTEGQLDEKYSRLRPAARGGLGTFGKKTGAVMLSQLRAMENAEVHPTETPKKTGNGTSAAQNRSALQEKTCNKDGNIRTAMSQLAQEWPAPPSPLTVTDSHLNQLLDGLSPLPPQPDCSGPEQQNSTFLPEAASQTTCTQDPRTTNLEAGDRCDHPIPNKCLSPLSMPIPPPSPDEVFVDGPIAHKPRPASCAWDGDTPSAVPSRKQRPMSIAGDLHRPPVPPQKPSRHTLQSFRASSLTHEPSHRTQHSVHPCVPGAAVRKSTSHELVSVGHSRSAPVPPDRSVSLEHIPGDHGTRRCQSDPTAPSTTLVPGPPAPKIARISRATRTSVNHSCSGDGDGVHGVWDTTEIQHLKNIDCPREGDLKRKHTQEDPYISQLSKLVKCEPCGVPGPDQH